LVEPLPDRLVLIARQVYPASFFVIIFSYMLSNLKKDLKKLSNPKKREIYQRFFKTSKGEYGEGDLFLGISVPQLRAISKKYQEICLADLQKLLSNKIHEYRTIALFILILKYKKTDLKEREKIVKVYLKNTKNINNWDLVDCSAHHILGNFLLNKDKSILYKLAKSKNLWERRIAIISCFEFIRNNQFKDVLKLSQILLLDDHDLIHKAVGWMLREVGKRDQSIEEEFLEKNYKKMPRTMLRYAIERFDEDKRQFYLKK
jgi:3-methyladenine DNA glycosylase AlkD